MSLRQLAEAVDVPEELLALLEGGGIALVPDARIAFAKVLGISKADLKS